MQIATSKKPKTIQQETSKSCAILRNPAGFYSTKRRRILRNPAGSVSNLCRAIGQNQNFPLRIVHKMWETLKIIITMWKTLSTKGSPVHLPKRLPKQTTRRAKEKAPIFFILAIVKTWRH